MRIGTQSETTAIGRFLVSPHHRRTAPSPPFCLYVASARQGIPPFYLFTPGARVGRIESFSVTLPLRATGRLRVGVSLRHSSRHPLVRARPLITSGMRGGLFTRDNHTARTTHILPKCRLGRFPRGGKARQQRNATAARAERLKSSPCAKGANRHPSRHADVDEGNHLTQRTTISDTKPTKPPRTRNRQ